MQWHIVTRHWQWWLVKHCNRQFWKRYYLCNSIKNGKGSDNLCKLCLPSYIIVPYFLFCWRNYLLWMLKVSPLTFIIFSTLKVPISVYIYMYMYMGLHMHAGKTEDISPAPFNLNRLSWCEQIDVPCILAFSMRTNVSTVKYSRQNMQVSSCEHFKWNLLKNRVKIFFRSICFQTSWELVMS